MPTSKKIGTLPKKHSKTAINKVLSLVKEQGIDFADLRFTSPDGRWHHVAQAVSTLTVESFEEGFLFDASSIPGWQAIDQADMALIPDPETAVLDAFSARPQLVLICDVVNPLTGALYPRDPRATARRAEEYLKKTGIADEAFFGPEGEFFIFDNARFGVGGAYSSYELQSTEGEEAGLKEYSEGNFGLRPGHNGGYMKLNPVDSEPDLRSEMLSLMAEMGLEPERHHHEVARSQHELGIRFASLMKAADNMQIYKYCVHNAAASYGKTATFMPKPILGENGSGMHVHQSIWKAGKSLFAGGEYAGGEYAGLSETALYYIGGILHHAKALNAFTNPSTNSYKRLLPGFEAPVLLTYSAANRSASCRIPLVNTPKGKRVEVRFPDATANPYLAFSAMLMAGLDGIQRKLHPGEAMSGNLYELPEEERRKIPTVCHSLRAALQALEADHEFLLEGGVFTEDQIRAHIALKMKEVLRLEKSPHPAEFEMYYSL